VVSVEVEEEEEIEAVEEGLIEVVSVEVEVCSIGCLVRHCAS